MAKKAVGWNIFIEYEDEEGNLTMEAWDISNWLGQEIDNEFTKYVGDDE
jgi:hypothetical protein